MDLPFLIYKGVFKMKKKNFVKLTLKEKTKIVRQYGRLIENGCSGQECESCPFFHGNYINLPDEVFHSRRLPCGSIYDLFIREVGKN